MQLFQPDGRLDANPGLGAQLAIENLQLSDFGLLEALKGHLNGNLRISGRLKEPLASLDLGQSPVGWQELDALAQGSAGWKDGRLVVNALRFTKGASTLDLSGALTWRNAKTGQWTAIPVLDLQASSAGLELHDVLPDYYGAVDLQARAKGPATNLLGDFSLEAEQVGLPVQKLNAVKLKGRLDDGTVHIDQMNIALAPDQNISGSGWYAFDQHYSVSLSADAINLRHIDALQQVYPVDGQLSVTLDGSGTLSQPNLEAVLAVADPRFNGQALDDFQGQFSLTGSAVHFQGDLNFQIRGRGDLDTHTYSLTADFKDTDLAPYLAIWPGPRWSGRLTGNLQAAGDWQAPERTTGRLELVQGKLYFDKLPFIAARGLNLGIENDTVTLPTTRLNLLQDGYLDISASGNLLRDLRLRVDGRLPLTALAPFTNALSDADGSVVVKARTQGPLSKRQWQADLNLKDIGFGLPDFSQAVEDLNGTVRLRPDQIAVESVTGTVDSGRFELGGNIRLDGGVPADGRLDLSLHALPLQWPDTMEMVISGDMALRGAPNGATLSGDLVLVEGLYYKDVRFNLLSGITQPRRSRPVPAYRPKPDWMKHVALDLKLRHRNPFLVDNNLARLEVAPDFQLSGTLAKPVMSGRAAVTEGELMYARKTFEVQRGVLDFVNPNKIEPNLDIMGTVEFRKWVITLGVSGTPDSLAFTLSSDPHESDSDILSLLLVGRTNAEMTQGEGGGRQTTNQMLAQLLATAWGEDIKREAGVDIFELGTGSEEDVDDPTRMQLTVGKRLSRRLTVKYDVETQEGETIQRAISEYRFLEHILASGFQDSRGKYGGELLFRMDYR
jgi:autotransporter translocation and assembly factor TamB